MATLFYIICLLVASVVSTESPELPPERHDVRRGNRQYAKENYENAMARYEQALQRAPASFVAQYNLGNALFKAERYDTAEQAMRRAAADSLRTPEQSAHAVYNLGDAQFAQQKLQEALESFKQSLRLNPTDMEAKYNYAYTKWLLRNNQQNGGGGDQDQQQDQNQDQQQDGQDQQDQNQEQQQGDREQDQQPSQNEQDPPNEGEGESEQAPAGISEQEQEQMLDAIQAQEDHTQDKLKEKEGVIVRGTKNW